jgi:hypothetical protein
MFISLLENLIISGSMAPLLPFSNRLASFPTLSYSPKLHEPVVFQIASFQFSVIYVLIDEQPSQLQ